MKYTNALSKESSPYLRQHAHNPVNWEPWSDTIFERAKAENKLVLISIGYSSCHWCHVMEHESFEDEEVATLMNKHFINVKVDREERPDVDQIYMIAVQLMTQRGGWPLNCFTTPDGRPFYGGTYFPKEQWMHILRSLNHTFTTEPERVEAYAEEVSDGVRSSEAILAPQETDGFKKEKLEELMLRWSKSFDKDYGGKSHAPKFPLPNNMEFLLESALLKKDQKLLNYVEMSLDRMAMGGIYDQIGGGFSRYSVDVLWKVPHFEKMLYDNGQLLALYARAYCVFPKTLYKQVIEDTVTWLEREMSDASGAFYSALDADSEGVEGKFYTWSLDELKNLLGEEYEWIQHYYCLDHRGFWEHGQYILLRREDDKSICQALNWTEDELSAKRKKVHSLLLSAREERIRPGLDNKCLTSWNAMLMQGLCACYAAMQDEHYLHLAQRISLWITRKQIREDGHLWRTFKEGHSTIDGFLEDYAHVISGFISLYQVSFDEHCLQTAKSLTEIAIQRFGDSETGMFFFTAEDTKLIARKMELSDNVIPASNSVMARNLYFLGHYFRETAWIDRAKQMLMNVYDGMENYGSGYSNWAILLNHEVYGMYEVVATHAGEDQLFEWWSASLPATLLAFSKSNSNLPIFNDKQAPDDAKLRMYVCTNGTCLLPTSSVTEAIQQVIQ